MIETLRHDSVFNSQDFSTPVHVIGCGATGSKIAIEIAKLGIKGEFIHLWDFDKVEPHNIANQAFELEDINKYKAEAVKDHIRRIAGEEVNVHIEEVVDQDLSGYVFLLTDTMASRKSIFENCINLNPNINFMVETRMGVDMLRVYSVVPLTDGEDKWIETLCDDDAAEVSACGATISVGATSTIIAGFAVWQFIKRVGVVNSNDKMKTPEFELLYWVNNHTLMVSQD